MKNKIKFKDTTTLFCMEADAQFPYEITENHSEQFYSLLIWAVLVILVKLKVNPCCTLIQINHMHYLTY